MTSELAQEVIARILSIYIVHPQIGHGTLKETPFPWPVARIVLQHRERINGTGYPIGITSDNILIEARILAVVDVLEAGISHRPYRPGGTLSAALEHVCANANVLYDHKIVDACLRLFKDKESQISNNKKQ